MPVAKGPAGVKQEMHKFKAGELHSGSPKGPIVTSRKQAIAISLHEAGMSKSKGGSKSQSPYGVSPHVSVPGETSAGGDIKQPHEHAEMAGKGHPAASGNTFKGGGAPGC